MFPVLFGCPPGPSSSPVAIFLLLQVSVSTLVLADDVPAAAQLLPHVGHLLAKGGVLPFQEGSPHRNLVLLQPPGVPRALGRLVVLGSPVPVLLILLSAPVFDVGVCGEEGGEGKTKRREE